jgi:hypothetical protein
MTCATQWEKTIDEDEMIATLGLQMEPIGDGECGILCNQLAIECITLTCLSAPSRFHPPSCKRSLSHRRL